MGRESIPLLDRLMWGVITGAMLALAILILDKLGIIGLRRSRKPAMGTCPDCGHEVTRDARACPILRRNRPDFDDLDRSVKRICDT